MNNRLVTTIVTAPLDMIKTNMYASGDYGVVELTNIELFMKKVFEDCYVVGQQHMYDLVSYY